jgi:hypothetical protein
MKPKANISLSLVAIFLLLSFAACSAPPNQQTPTGALKAYLAAKKNKELAAIKSSLSRDSLKMIENGAQAQNLSLDELLMKDEGAPIDLSPELRNERIEGDEATVEVKNSVTGEWESLPFVKEDGLWKLSLDRFMKELMRRINEGNKTPSNSANTN